MALQVNNNYSPHSRFYETQNCNFHNRPTPVNTPVANDSLSALFAQLSKMFASQGTNSYDNILKQLFSGASLQPNAEDYGGFKFKSAGEKAQVDQAMAALRAEQAANPGKAVSKKFKIGKYKYQVSLDENGQVNIKKKKKKRGFFSKLGGAFKSIGKGIMNFAKKALPIVSTLAMFVPGLQPFALAARLATGAMGVINGIKSGNIFGAVMSGVSALSGVGGKVGGFFSNLTSKAGGLLNNFGTGVMSKLGTTGQWLTNAFSTGKNWLDTGKQWLSSWTNGIGGNVTNFLNNRGTGLLNNLTDSFGGRFGQWLTQKGPDMLSNFASRMGNRAAESLYNKVYGEAQRVLAGPFSPRFQNLLNSGFAQFLIGLLQGRRV